MGRPLSDFYMNYIKSPEWRQRREFALERAKYRCEYEYDHGFAVERCSCRTELAVHHRTYERLSRELPEDLEVLCWTHHMVTHISQELLCKHCEFPVWTDAEIENWLRSEMLSIKDGLHVNELHWIQFPQKNQWISAIRQLVGDYCHTCQSKRKVER